MLSDFCIILKHKEMEENKFNWEARKRGKKRELKSGKEKDENVDRFYECVCVSVAEIRAMVDPRLLLPPAAGTVTICWPFINVLPSGHVHFHKGLANNIVKTTLAFTDTPHMPVWRWLVRWPVGSHVIPHLQIQINHTFPQWWVWPLSPTVLKGGSSSVSGWLKDIRDTTATRSVKHWSIKSVVLNRDPYPSFRLI